MARLELEGYLTGVITAPSPIRPDLWMGSLWGREAPVIDDAEQVQALLGMVHAMSSRLAIEIEQSLHRLEAERVCDYRPAFLTSDAKPSHDAIRAWVSGFWKAMTLVPTEWVALVSDERTRIIVEPFVGFIDIDSDDTIEWADDIDDRLDEAAAQIPRAILLLKKIADLRASRPARPQPARRLKIGRNDPCPCGSGKKSKRCCGGS
jgi:uncharacterized protein